MAVVQLKERHEAWAVSVIVPTRDRRVLLRRALDSVRGQTHPPNEIIVVDDGSRDDTVEMLRSRYPDVAVLQQEGSGVSAARNRGIACSRSPWIALLDSDDEWLPDKLARQLAALRKTPGAVVCHTDEIWVRNGVRVNPRRRHAKHGGHIFERCLPLCCISPSSILLHRSVLEDIGGFDETLPVCEDYDLWLRMTASYPVLLVDEPLLVKYGGHDDQLSRRYWGMDRFRIRALEKLLDSGGLAPEQRRAARRVLEDKVRIYAAGAQKRGRLREGRAYRAKLQRGLRGGHPVEPRTDAAAGDSRGNA